MVTCFVDLCRLESSDKHFWSLPDVQSLNVHLRILCLSFGRLQSGGIRFSRIIPHKMFKLTFEAVHRFVAGTSPPVARLSPRSPLTIFRYFPSFSSSSILRFFCENSPQAAEGCCRPPWAPPPAPWSWSPLLKLAPSLDSFQTQDSWTLITLHDLSLIQYNRTNHLSKI